MISEPKNVYVIGAGASHGARAPSPPLGCQLHHYVRDYLLKAWTELDILEEPKDGSRTENKRNHLKCELAKASSYESLVNHLLESNPNLLPKLNLLMANALMSPRPPSMGDPIGDPMVDHAFVEKPDLYDEWLKKILKNDSRHNENFVSLNYDCLLERAICRSLGGNFEEGSCLCKFVNYRLDEQDSGVEVLKPHGSINWVHDESDYGVPLTRGSARPLGQIDTMGRMSWPNIKAVNSPKGHEDIIMAHYAPGKEAQANPGTLQKIRDLALERIQKASFITIVGVHIPPASNDDPFLNSFMKELSLRAKNDRCKVHYVSPGNEDLQRASNLGFNALKLKFSDMF
ncbi:MAG: hypothetical protein AB7T38_07295 [Nitrospirales bacterium]